MKKMMMALVLSLLVTPVMAGDFLVITFKGPSSDMEKIINLKQIAYVDMIKTGNNGKPGTINISFVNNSKDVSIECKNDKAIQRIMKAIKKGSGDTVNASQCL